MESDDTEKPFVARLVSVRAPDAFPSTIYDAHAFFLQNDFDNALRLLNSLWEKEKTTGKPENEENVWIHSALTEVYPALTSSLSSISFPFRLLLYHLCFAF